MVQAQQVQEPGHQEIDTEIVQQVSTSVGLDADVKVIHASGPLKSNGPETGVEVVQAPQEPGPNDHKFIEKGVQIQLASAQSVEEELENPHNEPVTKVLTETEAESNELPPLFECEKLIHLLNENEKIKPEDQDIIAQCSQEETVILPSKIKTQSIPEISAPEVIILNDSFAISDEIRDQISLTPLVSTLSNSPDKVEKTSQKSLKVNFPEHTDNDPQVRILSLKAALPPTVVPSSTNSEAIKIISNSPDFVEPDDVVNDSDNSIILIDNPLFDSPPSGRRRRRKRVRRRVR